MWLVHHEGVEIATWKRGAFSSSSDQNQVSKVLETPSIPSDACAAWLVITWTFSILNVTKLFAPTWIDPNVDKIGTWLDNFSSPTLLVDLDAIRSPSANLEATIPVIRSLIPLTAASLAWSKRRDLDQQEGDHGLNSLLVAAMNTSGFGMTYHQDWILGESRIHFC